MKDYENDYEPDPSLLVYINGLFNFPAGENIFNRYIVHLKAEGNKSNYTLRNYLTDLLGTKTCPGFFQFLQFKNIEDIKEVDRQTIRDYLAVLVEKLHIEKASLSRKLSAIRSFFRFTLTENILDKTPIPLSSTSRRGERSTLSPKLDKKLPVFLTEAEMQQLLNTPDTVRPEGLRDRAMLELLYASGMRVSEIWQLNLTSMDLEKREVRVIGKGSKERIVIMGVPAEQAIKAYLSQSRPKLVNKGSKEALFLNHNGQRLSMRGIQKLLKHYAAAIGLEKNVHPHVLRHTFATHMLDGGADLRVVQELLGHVDLSTTQIYTHVTKQQARKVYLKAHPMAQEEVNDEHPEPDS
jgi:tyrosine recombinase XerC